MATLSPATITLTSSAASWSWVSDWGVLRSGANAEVVARKTPALSGFSKDWAGEFVVRLKRSTSPEYPATVHTKTPLSPMAAMSQLASHLGHGRLRTSPVRV